MRKLDVLFVHPNSQVIYQSLRSTYSAVEPPTWALLLAQSCRSIGYGVDILDCDALNLPDEKAVELIHGANPRLVCFVVYGSEPNQGTTRMSAAVPLATLLKNTWPATKIAFAGSHSQALPKEVLALPCVDFVLLNEGVYALHNLLATDLGTDLWKVKGIGWKPWSGNGCQEPTLNEPQLPVKHQEMDLSLPGYAWDLLPQLNHYRAHFWHAEYKHENRSPFAALYTSLGCYAKCSFCCVEGTKVIVANGPNKKIEAVTQDDTLVAYDENTNQVVETQIVAMSSREVEGFYRISLSDGKTIEVTGEHPLYVGGKWVEARLIKSGDAILVIDPSDKISLQKKLYNPTKREDIKKKLSSSAKAKWASGQMDGVFNTAESRAKRSKAKLEFYKTEEGANLRRRHSERMRLNNPMYDKDVAARAASSFRKKIESGELIPYMSTEEGRKVIGELARAKQSGPNNPMHLEKNRRKASERMRGENNPTWNGGTSYRGYGKEFTGKLKRQVRKRDNYTCQLCGHYGKGGERATGRRMHVHHVDYDKHNNKLCNLILLCINCHMRTNTNRIEWQKILSGKIMELGYTDCPHYVTVVSSIYVAGRVKVYNFECGPYNNYFANYILGHNCMINLINRINNAPETTAADSPLFRFWSHNHTLWQIEKLVEYGVRNIRFSDEMFFLKPSHYEPLLNGIKFRWGDSLNLWAYARVDTVKPRQLELFRSAGVRWLALGIEAGNTVVRKEASKGSFKDVDIRDVVKEIEDHGIHVISNFIFGLPGDNHESMQQTLALACELNSPMANFYPAVALPGTPLYKQMKQEGKELPSSYEAFGFLSYECQPTGTQYLTPAEVVKFRDDAFHTYYGRPEFLKRIEGLFGSNASSNIKEMLKVKLKRKLLGDPPPNQVEPSHEKAAQIAQTTAHPNESP